MTTCQAVCLDATSQTNTIGYYRQALALAEELGMRPLVAHCHLSLGKLYATTGPPRRGPR